MAYSAQGGVSGWAWAAMAVAVLLLAALSFGAFLILLRGGSRPARDQSAQRRLNEQFARGQITEQAYRRLSAELDAPRASRTGRLHVSGPSHRQRLRRRPHPR